MATDLGSQRGDVFPNFDEERRLRRHGPRARRPKPCLRRDAHGIVAERLEGRVLLSYTPNHDTTANVLTLTGDSNGDDLRIFEVNASPYDILKIEENGTVWSTTYTLNPDLTKVKVLAGGGDDYVEFYTNTYGDWGLDENEERVTVPAEIEGGTGNDVLTGTDFDDTIRGNDGEDGITGVEGNDLVYGYAGPDTLVGEAGNDTMYGGDGIITLANTDGNDQLFGGNDNDTLFGQEGDDILLTEGGTSNSAYGGGGNDALTASGGTNYLAGEGGNDTFSCDDDATTSLHGGSGTDSVYRSDGSPTDTELDSIELH